MKLTKKEQRELEDFDFDKELLELLNVGPETKPIYEQIYRSHINGHHLGGGWSILKDGDTGDKVYITKEVPILTFKEPRDNTPKGIRVRYALMGNPRRGALIPVSDPHHLAGPILHFYGLLTLRASYNGGEARLVLSGNDDAYWERDMSDKEANEMFDFLVADRGMAPNVNELKEFCGLTVY